LQQAKRQENVSAVIDIIKLDLWWSCEEDDGDFLSQWPSSFNGFFTFMPAMPQWSRWWTFDKSNDNRNNHFFVKQNKCQQGHLVFFGDCYLNNSFEELKRRVNNLYAPFTKTKHTKENTVKS